MLPEEPEEGMEGSRLDHVKPLDYGHNLESQDSAISVLEDPPEIKQSFDVEVQTLPKPTKRKDRSL